MFPCMFFLFIFLFVFNKMKLICGPWLYLFSCLLSLIYERFCGTDANSKDNSVGLQLLGIILANNLPAYDASCGIEYDR